MIKEPIPLPVEDHIAIFMIMCHFDFIEGFRDKGLDGFKALNYEPQSWELATAIADQLIC